MDTNMKNVLSCKALSFSSKMDSKIIQNGGQKGAKWGEMEPKVGANGNKRVPK